MRCLVSQAPLRVFICGGLRTQAMRWSRWAGDARQGGLAVLAIICAAAAVAAMLLGALPTWGIVVLLVGSLGGSGGMLGWFLPRRAVLRNLQDSRAATDEPVTGVAHVHAPFGGGSEVGTGRSDQAPALAVPAATVLAAATPIHDDPLPRQEATLQAVLDAVAEYEPLQAYTSELGYHAEMAGWLRARFPDLEVERQRGSSRPDIVIGDIALEIKGPTDVRELQTIADKCMRYSQHFSSLVILLFDVRASEAYYQEWHAGVKRNFPAVVIAEARTTTQAQRWEITCSRCAAADTVPFQPSFGSALFCRPCYRQNMLARRAPSTNAPGA